jgi:anti-anti-sigma factor
VLDVFKPKLVRSLPAKLPNAGVKSAVRDVAVITAPSRQSQRNGGVLRTPFRLVGDEINGSLDSTVDASAGSTRFTCGVFVEQEVSVVRVAGELDIASRAQATRSCVDGGQDVVILDLSELTFMDCCGYGGILEARITLEGRGGSLTLRHPVGEPARLLELLEVAQRGE